MLNPCKAKAGIWFVVELCEPIQVSSLELANFELYSSTPKDLIIYGSQNYPTREWISLGTYTASDERNLQHFDVKDQVDFMKYIKIEMQSHYGSEHYCPLSVLRAFGTTLVEEFDAIESGADKNALIEDDPDRQELGISEDFVVERPQNVIGFVRQTVINVVRQAAQILTKGSASQEQLDSVIAKEQFILHQRAIKVIDKIAPSLASADCIKFSRNFSQSNTTEINRPCLYIESILGLPLYQVICDELLREPALRFKCELNQTSSSHVNVPINQFNQIPVTLKPTVEVTTESPKILQNQQFQNASPFSVAVADSGITGKEVKSFDQIIPSAAAVTESVLNIASRIVTNPFAESVLPTPATVNSQQTDSDGSFKSVTVASPTISDEKSELNTTQQTNDDTLSENAPNQKQQPPQPVHHQQTNQADGTNQVEIPAVLINTPPTQQPITSPPVTSPPTQSATPAAGTANPGAVLAGSSSSKESIFIKLNNRIKALELNMSSTLLALEELSAKYQDKFNNLATALTLSEAKLNETSRVAATTELVHLKKIENLEAELQLVTEKVGIMVVEKETLQWQFIQIHIILMAIEIAVIIVITSYCVRKMKRILSTARVEDAASDVIANVATSTGSLVPSLTNIGCARVMPITPVKRANPGGINIFDTIREIPPAKTLKLEEHKRLEGKIIHWMLDMLYDFIKALLILNPVE